MKKLISAVFIFGVVLAFGSCHKLTKVDLLDQLKSAPEYSGTVQDWTKSTKHYYFDEVQFYITATYKSWPLRMAYLREYANKYKIPLAEQQAMYDKELADYKNYNDFFVTVFSSKKDINNLDNKEKWRIYLDDARHPAKVEPISLKKIEKDSVINHFWPMVNAWTSNYDLRFSRVLSDADQGEPDANILKLLLASVTGEETFVWNINKK